MIQMDFFDTYQLFLIAVVIVSCPEPNYEDRHVTTAAHL